MCTYGGHGVDDTCEHLFQKYQMYNYIKDIKKNKIAPQFPMEQNR